MTRGTIPSSSDDARSGGTLPHAQSAVFDGLIELAAGGTLPGATVVYETYGRLSPARDNAVLICHAISGDSHVARHDPGDAPGWWDAMVGPGRPIDTDRYFVICPNVLGGCRGTTGPGTINPATGRPWGQDFPRITIGDMVDLQARLIDRLGIEQLAAVIGGSLGGQQTLSWAIRHPERVGLAAALATAPRLTSQALAFDVVARNAILTDPHFHGGQYYDQPSKPDVGLAIARMLGHITYLSPEAMHAKFEADRLEPHDVATEFEKRFSVGSYLAYQGDKFVERFDANSYITLSLAMDLFDLGQSPAELAASLAETRCRWLVVSFSSDWLFPPNQSAEIVRALVSAGKRVTYCEVPTAGGHDAFLLPDEIGRFGALIRARLSEAAPAPTDATMAPAAPAPASSGATPGGGGASDSVDLDPDLDGDGPEHDDPTSIYHRRRLDYEAILDLIEPGASVLDLGCGRGGLLARLKRRGHTQIVGIEVEEAQILTTAARGLEVIDHDLNTGLPMFADRQFDYVVLSQTLQGVHHVEAVVDEMLRVGKRGVVSFPNFAFRELRKMLFEQGRSPKAACGYHYEWYNTPNRRFPSVADFEDFCRHKSITMHRGVFLDTEAGTTVSPDDDPNLNADLAIFVISR